MGIGSVWFDIALRSSFIVLRLPFPPVAGFAIPPTGGIFDLGIPADCGIYQFLLKTLCQEQDLQNWRGKRNYAAL
ncbi:MAG: hypothetical protein MUD08_01645 [Cytophagales bacterium]|jgi:hypothetical protein|nr:hypothetical protein [Cytophagales bacterium]